MKNGGTSSNVVNKRETRNLSGKKPIKQMNKGVNIIKNKEKTRKIKRSKQQKRTNSK
jgi:hypothetical protein